MKYKVLVLDLDGTLTNSKKKITDYTKKILLNLQNFMNQHLFSRVNIELQNTFVPDGMNENQDEECQRYEKLIAGLGGVDLQLLGLGHNGHIGFNEPAEVFVKQTHCVSLSEKTIQANQRFFESKEQVPKQAYTMGIGTIRSARKILINY